ncbi:alpha/beta fold hydrolase [Labedella endophytica]|uniref:Alpha/beta fold hydrolase n=1 Tax=Labedella endophytica TaxID=1523160 RepID=A0A3S1CUL7_9MICO|nr:alpha/beta fold hydrolase [Labedella endophytica]RUR03550.1 alpha/beta fold hydrolase [Labedella endophytica]
MTPTRLTRFRHDGFTFDVSDSGPLDGPVIVLLHGFPGSRRTWDAVTPLLEAGGGRVVAYDQRGYSAGARPRHRSSYRAADITGDALALIDDLGTDRVHVVGHDWGGFVAWRLAAVAPHRLTGVTILSTPHPRALARSLLSSAQLARSLYMGAFQLPVLPEALLRPRLARLLVAMGLPDGIAREYQRFLSSPGALRGALNWYRGMMLPDRRSGRTSQRRATADVTYVWGNRDPALGRRAAELTRRHARGDYRFVELDEGHWLPELAAEVVAREVLSRFEGGSGNSGSSPHDV